LVLKPESIFQRKLGRWTAKKKKLCGYQKTGIKLQVYSYYPHLFTMFLNPRIWDGGATLILLLM
jgi:hypothetical protein